MLPFFKTEPHSESLVYASILLKTLYGLQGLVIGLLDDTLQIKLKTIVGYSQIGFFLLCFYPFSLKFLWSPVVDTYFSPKLGARKSWIIPCQIISAVILFTLSLGIDEMLKEKNIMLLSFLAFCLMLCIATQDIAVDGWALNLCGKENTLPSTCQTIGQISGIFISTSVYVHLNSWNIISLSSYMTILSVVFVLVSLIILIYIPEDSTAKESTEGLYDTFNKIKLMCTNRTLLNFCGVVLISQIGHIFSGKVLILVYLDHGLSHQFLTYLNTCLIPVQIFLSDRLSSMKGNYLEKYLYSYKLLTILGVFEFLFVHIYIYLKPYEDNSFWIYFFNAASIVILSFMQVYFGILESITLSGFFNKICDKKIGATYITALYSISNLSLKWPAIFVFALVDFVGFRVVGVISLAYCVYFYWTFKDQIKAYEEKDESEWAVCKLIDKNE